jgi:tRNA(fMet)-specific endonuclease VapC
MNGKALLDTNIIIGLFAGEESVVERFSADRKMFLPSIVLGELFYGAFHSRRVKENIARIRELAAKVPVLSCNTATSEQYGDIKHRLALKGRLVPENDIWIASIAAQHKLAVISRDAHFRHFDSISVEIW